MGFDAYLERWRLRPRGRSADDHLCGQLVFRPDEGAGSPTRGTRRSQPKRSLLTAAVAIGFLCFQPFSARADKLSFDDRLEIERGLSAEYALMRVPLPRAKKPLPFHSPG